MRTTENQPSLASSRSGFRLKSDFAVHEQAYSQQAYRSMILIILSIFFGEILVMAILAFLPPLPTWVEAVVDSILLMIILSPLYFFFGFRTFVHYITELDRSEKALQKSERTHRLLVENLQEGIWYIDDDAKTVFVNPRMAEMLGYSVEEMQGQPLFRYMDEKNAEDFKRIWKNCSQCFYGQHDFEFLCKNGERINTHLESTPLENQKGVNVGALASVADITERKRAEDELKLRTYELAERVKELNCLYNIFKLLEKSEKPFEIVLQEVVNLLPTGWQHSEIACARIVYMGQEYTTENCKPSKWKQSAELTVRGEQVGFIEVLYLSEKWEYGREVFLREERKLIDAITGRLGRYIQRLQAEKALQEAHDELKKRVEKRTFDLRAANKKLLAEIEERKLVQEKLNISKTELQAVFDGILDPLIMVDKHMIVRMLNRSAMEYYRIDKQKIIGKPCNQVFKGISTPCEGCRVPGSLKDGKSVMFERKGFMDRDRIEQVSVYPMTENGGAVSGAILRISDITQKKEVEKQLIRADRLSSLGQLSGGIAHEIRNPLSGINLFVDILSDEEKYRRSNQEMEIFLEIKQNIHKINAIIKRILDMAKPTLEDPEEIDINLLIEDIVKLWYAKVHDAKVKLNLNLQKGLPIISGDAVGIQQVLKNLIQNAIEAMADGGSLSIATRNGVSSFYQDRPIVLIEVTDTGPGIAPEKHEQIFDPFFTTKTTGTGLGLSISYQIIEHHGGIISIESDPDQATSFMVELPCAPRSRE